MYYMLCVLCQRKVVGNCTFIGYSKYMYSTSTYILVTDNDKLLH